MQLVAAQRDFQRVTERCALAHHDAGAGREPHIQQTATQNAAFAADLSDDSLLT
jgi:hypothetical protein